MTCLELLFCQKDAPKGANISDDELLFLVEKELKAGHQKLFIVLHAYGSHFNYKERYPESMSVFKPDNKTGPGMRVKIIFDYHQKYPLHDPKYKA